MKTQPKSLAPRAKGKCLLTLQNINANFISNKSKAAKHNENNF